MTTPKEDADSLVEMALLVEALAFIEAKFSLVWLVGSAAFAVAAHWSTSRAWWLDAAFAAWLALRMFWFGAAFRHAYLAMTRREELEAAAEGVSS